MLLGVSKPSGTIRFTEKTITLGRVRTTTQKRFCTSLNVCLYEDSFGLTFNHGMVQCYLDRKPVDSRLKVVAHPGLNGCSVNDSAAQASTKQSSPVLALHSRLQN